MRMKESAETHEKARSSTYSKLPYIHVMSACLIHSQLTDVYFGVLRFSIKKICSLRLQHSPNVYRTYPRGEITHTQTKEEEEE